MFSKVMWVGRATVFLVGLAVILDLVFGVISSATAHTGSAGLLHLNHNNNITTTLTKLTGNLTGQVLTVDNNGTGPALSLQSNTNRPPMVVNAAAGTATGLSADELDGMNSTELEPRGYAQVTTSPSIEPGNSKGVIGVVRTDAPGNMYCFDLSFTPRAAVASAHLNNNATVGTDIGTSVPASCPETHDDAAAKTYGANDPDSAPRNDVNFGIVFM